MIVAVAEAFINQQILPTNNRIFIAKMVHEGKKMALLDWYLPSISEVSSEDGEGETSAWTCPMG